MPDMSTGPSDTNPTRPLRRAATSGADMPTHPRSELWPILIIGLGAWIVLGSMRRDR